MIQLLDNENEVYITVDTRTFFAKAQPQTAAAALPTKARLRKYMGGKPWQPWGDDNIWPAQVRKLLSKSPEALICLDVLCSYTYGNGLGVYEQSVQNNKKVKIPVYDEKQWEWLRQVNAQNYCVKSITDYWTLANTWTQMIPSRDRKSVATVRVLDAPYGRMGKWDETKVGIPDFYISGAWETMPTDAYIDSLPLTDMWGLAEMMAGKTNRFMYQGYSYTPGEAFYHEHPWHAMVRNGTLELAGKLPEIRKRMIDNSMFIKYHVRVEASYWETAYGERWTACKTSAERMAIKQEFYQMIEQKLIGSANAFKTIFSEKKTSERDGKEINLITIERVETDSGKEASFWQDIMASTASIFVGFGTPPPLIGPVLSDTKSRGGGSDINESKNTLVSRLVMHRDNILEPLDRAMRYNGLLKPTQVLGFEDTLLTTLDVNPNGQVNVAA
ncbi:MAG: hypothetical protein JSS76_08380 [Bacteroidetes bacterium]|nr:hypothetical protein [Bacteroidota bacterium]